MLHEYEAELAATEEARQYHLQHHDDPSTEASGKKAKSQWSRQTLARFQMGTNIIMELWLLFCSLFVVLYVIQTNDDLILIRLIQWAHAAQAVHA